jgi:DNA recombination protein RmuC
MDAVPVSALVIAVSLAAALLAFLIARLMDAGRRAGDRAEIAALRERLEERTAERDSALTRAETLRGEVAELRSRSAADAERVAWLQQAEKTLRETFEALASRTLQHSARSLTEQSRSHLDQFSRTLKADWNAQKLEISGLVTPVGEELRKLDAHVRTLEEKRQGAYQGVTEQIQLISEQYRALQQSTSSLDQALRAPNVRGKWGEVQLRRLVELAGMSEHVDFSEQVTTGRDGSGGGTTGGGGGSSGGRPDLVVRLPDQGIIPVDAKAPMSAYLEAQEAASPELSRQALKRHAAALRGHVQSLAAKAYWTQFERAPEFVVLLVPYESGLAAAFGADPELLEYALANRVIVTAPASFLALLRVVAYGWMQTHLSENAEAISRAGRELLERLGPFAEHLNRVGASLNQATDRFNDAAGSFERRVLPTARRLHELGAAADPPSEIGVLDNHARRLPGDEGTT